MKKGFTLIELLAVIVILAIIALIVTPVVSNIVANARIAANARSVEGHIRNIELAIISEAFIGSSTGDMDSYDVLTSGTVIEGRLSIPNNDSVTCKKYTIKHGTVLSATNCKSTGWGKKYGYTNEGGAVVTGTVGVSDFKGTFVEAETGDTHKGIVYMDPTNIKTVCTEESDINVTSRTTKSGCMKFYIYDDSGDTYKMILDRNTTQKIAWVSKADYNNNEEYGTYGNTSKGPITAMNKLESDTANWIGSPDLISADDIAKLVGAANANTISWSSKKPGGVNPVTQSTWFYFDGGRNSIPAPTTYSSTDGWQKQYASSTVTSNYAWLFDYTAGCTNTGCTIDLASNNGYWTKTKHYSEINIAWLVNFLGKLSNSYVDTQNQFGIRPVIEIDKDLIDG